MAIVHTASLCPYSVISHSRHRKEEVFCTAGAVHWGFCEGVDAPRKSARMYLFITGNTQGPPPLFFKAVIPSIGNLSVGSSEDKRTKGFITDM